VRSASVLGLFMAGRGGSGRVGSVGRAGGRAGGASAGSSAKAASSRAVTLGAIGAAAVVADADHEIAARRFVADRTCSSATLTGNVMILPAMPLHDIHQL